MQLLLAAISIMLDEWQWITDDWDTVEALLGQVTNDIMTNSRIGDIVATANAVLPSFGLACDGSSYERVDYPDLYAALDSAYIDDADNFHVPDLRDKTVLGAGNRSIGDTGGAETHSLAISEMPTHQHS